MMVETILESSQDFGMSSGTLPQWKRELLQRRLARARPPAAPPAPPPPPPPPPPPAADDDEELRYGPGIVKRLKSRYLSLALRDAPRRRPSVLRRAASLEHLLDERPPPAPRRAPVAPPLAPRRDAVKRARSVDALSRLEPREEAAPRSPEPRPSAPRAARPPRRPRPLLRETERPPPDVVRETLRKFESAPPRRTAPAARVSAALRGLEPRRSTTPERTPRPPPPPPPLPTESPPPVDSTAAPIEDPPRSPPPAAASGAEPAAAPRTPAAAIAPIAIAPDERRVDPAPEPAPTANRTPTPTPAPRSPPPAPTPAPSADEVEGCARRVSRAALEGIARAGCSVRYAFSAARAADHLPPLAAINPVLRRVGVIRPMPAARPPPEPPRTPEPAPDAKAEARPALVNGHSTPEPSALSRIGAAGIERAWSGSAVESIARACPLREAEAQAQAQAGAGAGAEARPAWLRGGAGRARAPPPPATSVVFNFSNRKEVPDYIENDGIILRASRRNRIKCGEPGVVVLRAEALVVDTEAEADADAGPPSPCDVRFVNDNVLINGKSSMPGKPNKDRIAKLKLQFDDSLTRTFEYPSETSLCEDVPPPCPSPAPAPSPTPPDNSATLADNTHIASAALSRYTPSKTCAAAFQLGLASPHAPDPPVAVNGSRAPEEGSEVPEGSEGAGSEGAEGVEGADARPCGADAARSWSDARAHRTDLLF